MATATQSTGRVPPPLLRSLQKLNGDAFDVKAGSTPLSPRSFATETTGKSSVSEEEMMFMLMEASQGHDGSKFFDSPVRPPRSKASMWKSVPNLAFDPHESPSAKESTWDFVNFDEEPAQSKPVMANSDHVHLPRRHTVASHRVLGAASLARPTAAKVAQVDRTGPSIVDFKADNGEAKVPSGLDPKLAKTLKKKRIKVRAGDLSIDSSGGSSVDRQQMQEAVRRWQSEHSTQSADGDLSSMQRTIQRRRSSAVDHLPDSSQGSGNGHIRVVIRRTKSLDDSSAMAQSLSSGESRLARPKRRTRSKSRSRSLYSEATGNERDAARNDATASNEASPKSRARSLSRVRRSSLSETKAGTSTAKPSTTVGTRRTRSRSRARPVGSSSSGAPASESPIKSRSKSLGRHFEESNHDSQGGKVSGSCSRSVSHRSAVSAPSRIASGSLIQRRRSRSLARSSAAQDDCVSLPKPPTQPAQTNLHPMNDMSRNRQPSDGRKEGSAVFQSKFAPVEEPIPPPPPPAPASRMAGEQTEEEELLRLIQETGITPEQFLKLREAGYLLTPDE